MDSKRGMTFRPWAEVLPPISHSEITPLNQLMIPTIETVRQTFFLEQLLPKGKSAFFTGVAGAGKSMIIKNVLNSLKEPKGIIPVVITFSANTTSLKTQLSLEEKLQKKRRDSIGAQVGKKIVVFIDDVNMPSVDQFGAQPPIELLRQLLDRHGLYDREKFFWKWIEDTTIICAAGPPGGGRNELSQRFTRKFNILSIPCPNKASLELIFNAIMTEHLKGGNYGEQVRALTREMVVLTIDTYLSIVAQLKPTPSKFQYAFNIRDVSKLFQGIMMAPQQVLGSADTAGRIWLHEMTRVFCDRMNNAEDKEWLGRLLVEQGARVMKTSWTYEDIFVAHRVLWTDLGQFDAPTRVYEELKDIGKLKQILEAQLINYNIKNSKRLQLVFFDEAIEKILRLARIFRQTPGHSMLMGETGCGKNGLTKLAAFLQKCEIKELDLKKDIPSDSFKTLLKEILQMSGVGGNLVCFVISDHQITSEELLENINSLLCNGEVPNLFTTDEMDKIIGDMRPVVAALKRDESRGSMYLTFIERVIQNLKIAFCMPLSGGTLRNRCRKFPSLINCCSLNYFAPWSNSALKAINSFALANVTGVSNRVKEILAEISGTMHTTVEDKAIQFLKEQGRYVYVAQNCCLDLIKQYEELMKQKKDEYSENKARYSGALDKIQESRRRTEEMKLCHDEFQNKIKVKEDEYTIAQKKVLEEQKSASEREKTLTIEGQELAEKNKKFKRFNEEFEAEMNASKPELEASLNETKQVDRKNLIEIKNFTSPHPSVVMVMEAIMTLLQEGTEWSNVKALLSDSNEFLNRLITFGEKLSSVPDAIIKKIKTSFLNNPEFDPDQIGLKSASAKPLAKWVKSICNYYDVLKKVEPKRKRFEEEKSKLEIANKSYATSVNELNEMKAKITQLKADCDTFQLDKNKILEEVSVANRRLGRAEELVALLAEEAARWEAGTSKIQEDMERLVGNVLLAAASVTYFGPFTENYRTSMTSIWIEEINKHKLPVSEDYTLEKLLGNPATIREWGNNGLALDRQTIENGIISTTTHRWPLMIDPQLQANKWLKINTKKQILVCVKSSMKDFLKLLSNAMRVGKPLLIEDAEDIIDSGLDSLLQRAVVEKESGIKLVRVDNKDLEYDDNFKLYITTRLHNPHYTADLFSKVTVINFTLPFAGLEAMLLNDVIRHESAEIETQKEAALKQRLDDTHYLKDAEERILKQLSGSALDQLLDDEAVSETLKNAKKVTSEILKKLEEGAKIEAKILESRKEYINVATRGAILYYAITDLIEFDAMYQYSLEYVRQLFNSAIEHTEKAGKKELKIQNMIANISKKLYNTVAGGLLYSHRLLFAFLLSTAIKRKEGQISEKEWSLFIREPKVIIEEACPKFLNEKSWGLAIALEKQITEVFAGLSKNLKDNAKDWQEYAAKIDIFNADLPRCWEKKLTSFAKLLLVKVLRPEKIFQSVTQYIKQNIGSEVFTQQLLTVEEVFNESKKATPIIFILSEGKDPTKVVINYAEKCKCREKLTIISMGQDQGLTAKKLIQVAQGKGEWILLENCHLAKNWLKELEQTVEMLKEPKSTVLDEFRIILTSLPVDYFPASLLQSGLKISLVEQTGIKANLRRSYKELIPQSFNSSTKKPQAWHKLLFSLCCFHSIVQERWKFGHLGFQCKYQFNENDLEHSIETLKVIIEEQDEIQWDAITFITGQANYGGRVSNDWDRRAIYSMLKIFFNNDALNEGYAFSESKEYYAPLMKTIAEYNDYIEGLPENDLPEVFGLHESTNISKQTNETISFMGMLLKLECKFVEK